MVEQELYAQVVRQEQAQWSSKGIRSVPSYLFEGEQLLSGVHESQVLAKVILEVAKSKNRRTN